MVKRFTRFQSGAQVLVCGGDAASAQRNAICKVIVRGNRVATANHERELKSPRGTIHSIHDYLIGCAGRGMKIGRPISLDGVQEVLIVPSEGDSTAYFNATAGTTNQIVVDG